MPESQCKVCRRAGEKLFLKGDRCFSPKCAFEKRAYTPGRRDSERKHRSTATEYGLQLREKQKVRNTYRLSEKQFSNYVKKASTGKGNPSETLFGELESRLDNVVSRLGFARSRSEARQLVSHGHIMVNGRRCNVPSRQLKIGDKVMIRKESEVNKFFAAFKAKTQKTPVPQWMTYDAKTTEAVIKSVPVLDKTEFNLTSVIEFYSR